ncbi:glutaminyl-peptide cyclotransferase [Aggregicoccus sp. 17bor-14]|uniref:Vgb family protein n=1 Tax=Myxococcaceae TaxID=31 RepID=UPI00129C57EE|nr:MULTISPECIES: PQQ-binding-like beta-propeller repeat protein [Myxococcaceae]MBF5043796.1 glutamine cyclotransferase [Simulacricoccus sp. 17bor-14]MRI89549.1 glutaminyl-peptide cyclotransferase [Aggregicoccus sp. 17bor-14]
MSKPDASAEVVREYIPLDDGRIHGVTFDGRLVWFARNDELVAFDPESEQVVRRFAVPGANAGTAFDGEHLYQLARGEILVLQPSDGRVVRRLPAPGQGQDTGMAWADGYLWVGQYASARIHKVDARTGAVVKTLASDRFVTGVSCVDGALWHAVSESGKPCELRRLAPDGTVQEAWSLPVEFVAGVEGNGAGGFWCAGERGTLRLVRKASARRGSAPG